MKIFFFRSINFSIKIIIPRSIQRIYYILLYYYSLYIYFPEYLIKPDNQSCFCKIQNLENWKFFSFVRSIFQLTWEKTIITALFDLLYLSWFKNYIIIPRVILNSFRNKKNPLLFFRRNQFCLEKHLSFPTIFFTSYSQVLNKINVC